MVPAGRSCPTHSKACVVMAAGNFQQKTNFTKTDKIWRPHSPDLSPFDFSLLGYLKDYKPKQDNQQEYIDKKKNQENNTGNVTVSP